MSLPLVTLSGNLVADPELRFTPSGKGIAKFRVACNNRIRKGDEWVDGEACFVDVVVWELKAEAIVEAAVKGTAVMVTGRLSQRQWEDKDGGKRTAYEVTADEVAITVRGGKGQQRKVDSDPWTTNQPGRAEYTEEPPF